MYYEVNAKFREINPDGKEIQNKTCTLCGCEFFAEAEERTMKALLENPEIKDVDITSIKRSKISEVVNEDDWSEDTAGWMIRMQREYMNEKGKTVKSSWWVLIWSEDCISTDSEVLVDYLKQIDPDGNEFKVVGITKTNVELELK